MRILIVSNQLPMPDEQWKMRINTLYDVLTNQGHNVTVLTSLFNHYDKVMRSPDKHYDSFNVVLVPEPGYKKNVSLKRIRSQKVFAKNCKKWFLNNYQNFDCVFAVVPTYETIYEIGTICKEHEIPILIDVEDLWPEAMMVVLKKNIFSKIVLNPMKKLANKTYALADGLTAVSQEYLDRALSVNTKSKTNSVIYLGVDLGLFQQGVKQYAKDYSKPSDEFWVCYLGTLGASYDVKTLIDAISIVHNQGFTNVKCKILGKGPEEDELKQYSQNNNIEIDFVGFLDYAKMAGFVSHCDLMINPIKANASQSVINKVGDYFASGKPVLNSCVNKEMKALITDYDVGSNYEPGNAKELSELILKYYKDNGLCNSQGKNSFELCKKLFDRKVTYQTISNQLEKIAAK